MSNFLALDISVVTINYNNTQGLALTIDSVLAQDYPNLQYIIIDGGSTDGSADIIRQQANRLHYWESTPDRGIYHAQNKGLAKATGEYVLFLNSGDVFLQPDSLSTLALQTGPGRDLVFGNLMIKQVASLAWLKTYPAAPDKAYLRNDSLPHCATLIRTKLLKDAGGYDESLRIVSDWKFFAQAILKQKVGVYHVTEAIALFAFDGISSLAQNRELLENEMSAVWQQLFPPPGASKHFYAGVKRKIKNWIA
jgi:glycosyltransferase involved in cell wall biosynthesis